MRELKPDRFDDLIAMNALYRPGPMEYIPALHRPKARRESGDVRSAGDGGIPAGHIRHYRIPGADDVAFAKAGRFLQGRCRRAAQGDG